jgi:hypothetical protein
MKLYLSLRVNKWSNLSSESRQIELVDDRLGMGYCSVFTTLEDAMKYGNCTKDEVLEVNVVNPPNDEKNTE